MHHKHLGIDDEHFQDAGVHRALHAAYGEYRPDACTRHRWQTGVRPVHAGGDADRVKLAEARSVRAFRELKLIGLVPSSPEGQPTLGLRF